ncbi:358_t:CDS:1 [Acaulospora morrowiae]|uniref:358_t:CDS:1 n=1 Tax=Acaulospora morrowiae TaxID=94023 RepID=A0A9N8VEX4_9GLOM|nr:358_t:CDS:1 [Acaulospora morrowiae]
MNKLISYTIFLLIIFTNFNSANSLPNHLVFQDEPIVTVSSPDSSPLQTTTCTYPYPTHTFYPTDSQIRALAYFNPPDTATGLILFWETSSGITIIHGQFSRGFKKDSEEDISIKIYRNNEVIFDLKPQGESLANLFKIRPNGSTDSFVLVVPKRLIREEPKIIGAYVVIERKDDLIAKDPIILLEGYF